MEKTKIGVVGCGSISGIYLKNLTSVFGNTAVVAVCDLEPVKAQEKAREFGIGKVYSYEEMLEDPEVKIVLNLTTPHSHFNLNKAALLHHKHVYVEKPLCIELDEGRELLELAGKNNLYIGSAPDTFLGAGIQTAMELISKGEIGRPVAANAFMMGHGHESWHPDPEFYYCKGGGPMFDMGPYYLTALVNLIGPVAGIAAMARITFPQRTITSSKKYGKIVEVEVPTHVNGIMEFENGAIGTLITSFDVWGTRTPCMEIHGSEGSLSVPDPNGFGGQVLLKKKDSREWVEVPHVDAPSENMRGIGVSRMADALGRNESHPCNGRMACHVLELMHGFHLSADRKRNYDVQSRF
ncbi:MAG: Gfo/Idh/MocA family oxidoreductase [Clostridia bacterium]